METDGSPLFLHPMALPAVVLSGVRAGPILFLLRRIQHLEPTRAIIVSCLEPVFSIVIAAIALGEIMRPFQVLGNRLGAGRNHSRPIPTAAIELIE